MEKFNFNFNIGNKFTPYITITKRGLKFNFACMEALRRPKYITIGLDVENKKLAVLPKDNCDDTSMRHYKFILDDEYTASTVTIFCKPLLNTIINLLEITPQQSVGLKFNVNYISNDNIMYADLNEYHY